MNQEDLDAVKAARHHIHQNPELTWQEFDTAKYVADSLRKISGIDVTENIGKNGVVGLLKGASEGPVVALRADMDALPIQEETGVEYASKNPGVMHACGHDGHVAILLGAAKILASKVSEISGSIKFIFQPAEEGGAGARHMCDDGVLENPKVDTIFGLHGWPELPCGDVGLRSGSILASAAEVRIEIEGKGGHAAFPNLAVDPILIGAQVVQNLQSIASRFVAPTEPVVLSITQFNAGTAFNVIPKTVLLQGTLRTVSSETKSKCIEQITKICQSAAESVGGKATVNISVGYPPTINDPEVTDYAEKVATKLLSEKRVNRLPNPSMGGEDFSYYLEKIPGTFFFLGLGDGRKGGYPSLHHPEFDFNDAALQTGIEMFVELALGWSEGRSKH